MQRRGKVFLEFVIGYNVMLLKDVPITRHAQDERSIHPVEDQTIDYNHGTEKSQPSIDFDKTGSCPSTELEATTVCW